MKRPRQPNKKPRNVLGPLKAPVRLRAGPSIFAPPLLPNWTIKGRGPRRHCVTSSKNKKSQRKSPQSRCFCCRVPVRLLSVVSSTVQRRCARWSRSDFRSAAGTRVGRPSPRQHSPARLGRLLGSTRWASASATALAGRVLATAGSGAVRCRATAPLPSPALLCSVCRRKDVNARAASLSIQQCTRAPDV